MKLPPAQQLGMHLKYEWRDSDSLDFRGADKDRTVWLYFYSWVQVKYVRLLDYEECDYEASHYCEAPENTDQDYLLATGYYAWSLGLNK